MKIWSWEYLCKFYPSSGKRKCNNFFHILVCHVSKELVSISLDNRRKLKPLFSALIPLNNAITVANECHRTPSRVHSICSWNTQFLPLLSPVAVHILILSPHTMLFNAIRMMEFYAANALRFSRPPTNRTTPEMARKNMSKRHTHGVFARNQWSRDKSLMTQIIADSQAASVVIPPQQQHWRRQRWIQHGAEVQEILVHLHHPPQPLAAALAPSPSIPPESQAPPLPVALQMTRGRAMRRHCYPPMRNSKPFLPLLYPRMVLSMLPIRVSDLLLQRYAPFIPTIFFSCQLLTSLCPQTYPQAFREKPDYGPFFPSRE